MSDTTKAPISDGLFIRGRVGRVTSFTSKKNNKTWYTMPVFTRDGMIRVMTQENGVKEGDTIVCEVRCQETLFEVERLSKKAA